MENMRVWQFASSIVAGTVLAVASAAHADTPASSPSGSGGEVQSFVMPSVESSSTGRPRPLGVLFRRNSEISGEIVSLSYGPSLVSRRLGDSTGTGNHDTSHLLGLICDKDGRQRMVDFGNAADLGEMSIGIGERITITGRMLGGANNRTLVARELRMENRTVEIGPTSLQAQRPGTTVR